MAICKIKCSETRTLGPNNKKIMVSNCDDKYPLDFCHEQCKECAEEEVREILYCIAMGKSRKI
jgi:hypothetical protein